MSLSSSGRVAYISLRQDEEVPAARQLQSWLRRPLEERSLAGFVLHRMRWTFVSLAVLAVIGTIGYMTISRFGFLDALYMTVITLSTVGYNEVHPLTADGRIFTIAVIVAGFGTLVYAAATMTNLFTSGDAVEHHKRSRGRRMREVLTGHVIVVGFGRVGQAVAHSVRELGLPCLVIDRDPDRETLIEQAGLVALVGDATSEPDLLEAGIDRARALVAAAELDQVNLIVTLTARAIRPGIRIVSRVNEPTWRERMVRAGANIAESPYTTYGMSLAMAASSDVVLDVRRLPLLGFGTEEIEVTQTSTLVGRTLGDVGEHHRGVFIVGLRREQSFQRWHEVEGPIAPGDVLVALGDGDSLVGLAAEN